MDCLAEIFKTWGSSDKAAGMPGCPGPIADPDNPCSLRTAAVALCGCLFQPLRKGAGLEVHED